MVTRTRHVWTYAAAACLSGLLGLNLVAAEQATLPTAADIIAKYVSAIGGEAAWRGLTSVRIIGTTEFPAQGIKGTFEIVTGRPDSLVLRMDIPGLGRAESGYHASVGWTLDPMVGPSLVTGDALAELRNDAHFDAPLHPASLIASAVTTARVEFDGRQAYKVAVTFVSGQKRDEYYDVESGLLLGNEGESHTDMGKVPGRMFLRDYRQFGTVRQPGRLVQSAMGIEQHFLVTSMELNAVPASAFDPPPVIKALIKKTPTPEDAPWRANAIAAFDDVWNTINDTFYDPAFGGVDWAGLKTSLRPRVMSAATHDEARGVIREMLATLKRSHLSLLSASASDEAAPTGDATLPFDVRLIDNTVVVTRVEPDSSAARAGVRSGHHLIAIDDVDAKTWLAAGASAADPRTRSWLVWRRVLVSLSGRSGSVADVTVHDGTQQQRLRVARVQQPGSRVTLGDLPPFHVDVRNAAVETSAGRAVGVIRFNVWMASANQPIEMSIDRHRGSAGLVIDLRGNPGGLANMIRGVAGHLVREPVVLGRMKTRDSELEFPANPRLVMADGRRVEPFAGPVALLVDELTASASECFAGGLQSLGRVRVFGRTTAGQALPASLKRLPNGDVLMFAIGDFVTSTGVRLEGAGVVPDEPVTLDPAVLRAGKDPDLEAALRWIDGQVAKSS